VRGEVLERYDDRHSGRAVDESGYWYPQNDPEPLYVAVSNSSGDPAVVVHDDPAAANMETWTEWVIPLQTFADQGIDLTNVDKLVIYMENLAI